MDTNDPVIKLCVAGMEAEGEGRPADAAALFAQAWEARHDEYTACIAAHYVARHQPTPIATLHWNQLALTHADAVAPERIRDFYPSLYLNMGKSYEALEQMDEAQRYYTLAAEVVQDLPDSPYANIVRYGIRGGQNRVP